MFFTPATQAITPAPGLDQVSALQDQKSSGVSHDHARLIAIDMANAIVRRAMLPGAMTAACSPAMILAMTGVDLGGTTGQYTTAEEAAA